MTDTLLAALLSASTTLAIAIAAGIRWWVTRCDRINAEEAARADAEEELRLESETEATETVSLLEQQNMELEIENATLHKVIRAIVEEDS